MPRGFPFLYGEAQVDPNGLPTETPKSGFFWKRVLLELNTVLRDPACARESDRVDVTMSQR